jgi:hypothetical protein
VVKKIRVIAGLVVFFALAFHAAPAACAQPQADGQEDYSIAYINDFKGDCEMTQKGAGESEPVQDIYIPLHEGDTVSTGDTGSMEIVFDDATIVNLDGNSRLTIENLNRGDGDRTILSLIKGSLTAIVKKLMQKDEFMVKTNMAMAAVKGTEFSVEAGENHRVGVFDGSVQVSGVDQRGRVTDRITVNKGSETVIDKTMRRPGRPGFFSENMKRRAGYVQDLRKKIVNLRALRKSGGLRRFKLDRRMNRIKYLKWAVNNHEKYRNLQGKRKNAVNRVIMQEQKVKEQMDAIDKNDNSKDNAKEKAKKDAKKRWKRQ